MDSGHSDWHEMVPHCGFDLHFSDNEWCWASFHVFVSHLYVFFGETSGPFFDWVIYLFFCNWAAGVACIFLRLVVCQLLHLLLFSPILKTVFSPWFQKIFLPDAKSWLIGKDPGARKDWRPKSRRRQSMRWLLCIADSVDMSLSKLWEIVEDIGAWCATVHEVRHNLVTEHQH